MPATILIAISGKIYGQIKGQTVEFKKSFNIQIIVLSIIILSLNIFKFFAY